MVDRDACADQEENALDNPKKVRFYHLFAAM